MDILGAGFALDDERALEGVPEVDIGGVGAAA